MQDATTPFHSVFVASYPGFRGIASGRNVDVENGRSDGAERGAVERLCLVVVNQVRRGHLQRLAAVFAREAAELLGEDGVQGPDNSEVRNQIAETRNQVAEPNGERGARSTKELSKLCER